MIVAFYICRKQSALGIYVSLAEEPIGMRPSSHALPTTSILALLRRVNLVA
jgi:hypothetical protein